jgi:hypothetical protein
VAAATGSVPLQEVYGDLVKTVISPKMRGLGLTGSGGRYSLPSGQCWALASLQKSAYSDGAEIRFTLNLLVANKATWASARSAKPYLPERPNAGTRYGAGEAQSRIGALIPGGEDTWWRIYQAVDLTAVSDDLLRSFEQYGLPWLKEHIQALGSDA